MKIEKMKRAVTLALCAVVLSLSISTAYSVPVQAADTEVSISLEKLLDMCLTKTGVSANNNLLQKVQASILNTLNGTVSSYSEYCKANGLEKNDVSWSEYLNSEAYAMCGYQFPSFLLDCIYFFDWLFADSDGGSLQQQIMESDYVQFLCDSAVAVQGEKYVVSDEAVEYIRKEFDTVADEEVGYFYIDSYSPDDLYPLWFETTAQYEHVKKCLESGSGLYSLLFRGLNKATADSSNSYICDGIRVEIYKEGFFVGTLTDGYAQFYCLDETNDNYCTYRYYDSEYSYSGFMAVDSLENLDSYNSEHDFYQGEGFDNRLYFDVHNGTSSLPTKDYHFFTNDGRQIKIWKSLNHYRLEASGYQPYYVITTYDYSTTNDNSMTFDGNYYRNNGDVYSYDTVKETIDNSVDNSYTEIDNSITNIVNNYYGSSGSDDNSGDSSGNGDSSSGAGVTDFLTGLTDLFDFILGLLGNIISLLSTFLNSALSLLSGLGTLFGGFSDLLGEMFTFLPEEFIDALTAGLTLLIGLAIYKAAKS